MIIISQQGSKKIPEYSLISMLIVKYSFFLRKLSKLELCSTSSSFCKLYCRKIFDFYFPSPIYLLALLKIVLMVSTIIVIIIKYADKTDIRCFKFTTELEPSPRSLLDLC